MHSLNNFTFELKFHSVSNASLALCCQEAKSCYDEHNWGSWSGEGMAPLFLLPDVLAPVVYRCRHVLVHSSACPTPHLFLKLMSVLYVVIKLSPLAQALFLQKIVWLHYILISICTAYSLPLFHSSLQYYTLDGHLDCFQFEYCKQSYK